MIFFKWRLNYNLNSKNKKVEKENKITVLPRVNAKTF